MKPQIYNQPKYYEIAFSFVDAKKQVELFENQKKLCIIHSLSKQRCAWDKEKTTPKSSWAKLILTNQLCPPIYPRMCVRADESKRTK